MYDPAEGKGIIPQDGAARYHKKDFWSKENLNFSRAARSSREDRANSKSARGRQGMHPP